MAKFLLPEVPVHHRGKRVAVTRNLAKFFLRVTGWQVTGRMPEQRRVILIVGPHTSNWDFVYGLSAAMAMNVNIHWLGKHTLFKPPLTLLMNWLGGIPVDRSRPQGVAEQVADKIRRAGNMALIITPEGTRSKVAKWKTGFLRITAMSDSVMMVTAVDYAKKVIDLGEVLIPSDDAEADIQYIQSCFARATPKHSHNH